MIRCLLFASFVLLCHGSPVKTPFPVKDEKTCIEGEKFLATANSRFVKVCKTFYGEKYGEIIGCVAPDASFMELNSYFDSLSYGKAGFRFHCSSSGNRISLGVTECIFTKDKKNIYAKPLEKVETDDAFCTCAEGANSYSCQPKKLKA